MAPQVAGARELTAWDMRACKRLVQHGGTAAAGQAGQVTCMLLAHDLVWLGCAHLGLPIITPKGAGVVHMHPRTFATLHRVCMCLL